MNKLMMTVLMFLVTPAISALAEGETAAQNLPETGIILPWLVGIGIFVAAVICGFKNSGRTHLD